MDISLILNDKEIELLNKYADKYNMSPAEFIKDILIERLKDEKDMEVYEEAIKKYHKPAVELRYSLFARSKNV